MNKEINKVTMTFSRTANGWYVEYTAEGERHGYSVPCDGEWESLNPVLHGVAAPFVAKEKDGKEKTAVQAKNKKETVTPEAG
ncbi:hypothetical protein [Treponema phagedenis]|uniref:Uncharacterized protein n=1 Tax=Treponema phagedenis TaxID=162 RepID=A0A7H8VLX8_TREPH|nr:hypothetical protein [Treponema phagedenis]NVP22714.1 hypothetical protein [Treponema phagedenis]NVP23237.1 hypothetical protein [Treponema phagedenis]QEJ95336.1 hypothetical protein FUT79_09050 [Treponema phagedenis]QEJ97956.1 hypothetical protein FUT82_08070 [Treponema phagedenis]QEK01188.1 hypothetical protein FUT84_08515 [Treponema phagedenis]